MKLQHLNLSYLKFFIDTVESQSFTRAADLNAVSRPAISQGLARLEEWYGQSLMLHKKREFKLTSAGESFYRVAKDAYLNFSKQISLEQTSNQSIHIGCSASLAESVLGPAFKNLGSLQGLKVKTGGSAQLLRYLEDGEINLAIYVDSGIQTTYPTSEIRKGQFALYSPSGQIENLTLVTEDRPEVSALKSWLTKKRITTSLVTIESWSLALTIVQHARCNVLIPDVLAPQRLKKISLPGYQAKYRVAVTHKQPVFLSPSENEFLEKIKNLRK